MTKTRFAPSPTGEIHLGNLRTALFNYLEAAHTSGKFLLRIEDTDKKRSKLEHLESLIVDFNWLNITWSEGYQVGGENGPYCQAQRIDIYEQYYQQLFNENQAYYCFCSEAELALSKKLQRAQGLAPKYSGKCRNLSKDKQQKKISNGILPVIRFKVPEDSIITFIDKLKGSISFETKLIGDFIIRRNTKAPSFMFANAVDDALMNVQLVMRGEDHLTNTPRQLMILNALKLPQPEYGHIPLITGPDGSPLSKRHGSKSVKTLRSLGYTPIAIWNYLSRLGHTLQSEQLLTQQELEKNFSITNITKSNARFDEAQLNFWQKKSIQLKTQQEIKNWLLPEIIKSIPELKLQSFLELVKNNVILYSEVNDLIEQLFGSSINIKQDHLHILNSTNADFFQQVITTVTEKEQNFQNIKADLQENLSVKGKSLFQPLRVALTGQLHGPEMPLIIDLMDKQIIVARMQQAMEIANAENI